MSLWQDVRYGLRGMRSDLGFSALAMIPYTVAGNFERGILVRTAGNPMPLLDPVRREIWAVHHNVALTMTRTLEDFLSDFSYSRPRFVLLVLGVFAGICGAADARDRNQDGAGRGAGFAVNKMIAVDIRRGRVGGAGVGSRRVLVPGHAGYAD